MNKVASLLHLTSRFILPELHYETCIKLLNRCIDPDDDVSWHTKPYGVLAASNEILYATSVKIQIADEKNEDSPRTSFLFNMYFPIPNVLEDRCEEMITKAIKDFGKFSKHMKIRNQERINESFFYYLFTRTNKNISFPCTELDKENRLVSVGGLPDITITLITNKNNSNAGVSHFKITGSVMFTETFTFNLHDKRLLNHLSEGHNFPVINLSFLRKYSGDLTGGFLMDKKDQQMFRNLYSPIIDILEELSYILWSNIDIIYNDMEEHYNQPGVKESSLPILQTTAFIIVYGMWRATAKLGELIIDDIVIRKNKKSADLSNLDRYSVSIYRKVDLKRFLGKFIYPFVTSLHFELEESLLQ